MRVRRVATVAAAAAAVATVSVFAELVGNAASAEQRWPGWLAPLQRHPWLAFGVLAAATVLLTMFVAVLSGDPVVRTPPPEGGAGGPTIAVRALSAVTATVTNSLPRDVEVFAGRDREMGLLRAAGRGLVDGHAPRIYSIDGMPGVGKTTLAVRAAHALSTTFPDGQLFVDLHGHNAGERPADPCDTLAALLIADGIAAARIPAGLDARSAMWRDRLHDRRVVLVLDDAVSSEQVRPLLPGTTRSLVLITSRRRLSALDGATPLSLATLPPHEAAELFTRLADRSDLRPTDPAVVGVARLCGWLPLALRLMASQLQHHRAWTADVLARRLAVAHDRAAAIEAENVSVSAAFDLSYRDLTTDLQRLLRRLGHSPGESFDAYAAAAVDDLDLNVARSRLEELYLNHVVEEPAYGRYRMHDLLRAHARGQNSPDDPDGYRHAVLRLLDYYLHSAVTAGRLLVRRTRIATSGLPTAKPQWMPDLATREQAMAWLETEQANVRQCADYAASHGWSLHAVYLSLALSEYLLSQGPWDQALAIQHDALAQAEAVDDIAVRAEAHQALGIIQQLMGQYPAALASQRRALDLFRSLGDRHGEARALNEVGVVQRQTANYADAENNAVQALALFTDADDELGQAAALHNRGYARQMTGDYAASILDLKRSLALARKHGDRLGQGQASDRLSFSQLASGDYTDAAKSATEALRAYRDVRNRVGEANATNVLGLLKRLAGDYAGAREDHRKALDLYRELGDRLGEANALDYLGIAQQLMGDYPGALASLTTALQRARTRVGDRVVAANVLNDLGMLQRLLGDHAAATASHREALQLYDEIGDRLGKANALSYLGVVAVHSGDADQAQEHLSAAMATYVDIGERLGQAEVLNSLGDLARLPPDGPQTRAQQARAHYTAARDLARDINSPLEEARATEGLGRCLLDEGSTTEAISHLRDAHAIYQRIGANDARRLEVELAGYA